MMADYRIGQAVGAGVLVYDPEGRQIGWSPDHAGAERIIQGARGERDMSDAAKYDASVERIEAGSTVAQRSTGRIIGQVDELGEGDGSRWVLVSWPAEDLPHARTDERGRRCQVFSLSALAVVEGDYGAINDPPSPEDDRDELARIGDQLQAEDDLHDAGGCEPASCPVCAWVPEPGEVWPASFPAAGWDELDCSGVYDGFQVVSDADPGL